MKSLKRMLRVTGPYLIIAAVAVAMVMPQVIMKHPILGVDSNFHLNRIYDSAMQIKHFNFSYFQMNYGFTQSARIVNALYGPIWSYILAVVMLVAGNVTEFEVLSDVLLLVVGGVGMYLLNRKSGSNKTFAVTGAAIFMNTGWFPSWLTGQEFTSWGMMVMPYILIMGVNMIQDHNNPIKVLPLAISVAVIVQIHVLSSLFVVVALIPYFLIGMINADRKLQMGIKVVLAAILALMMTANVWGGMLNVLFGNNLIKPFAALNMYQLSTSISLGNNSLFALGLVCSIMFLVQIIIVLSTRKLKLSNYVNTYVGLAFLLVSSKLFPWQEIAKRVPSIQSLLQFPSRLGTIAGILLIAGLCSSLTEILHAQSKTSENVLSVDWPRTLMIMAAVVLGFQNIDTMYTQLRVWETNKPIQRMANIYVPAGTSADAIRSAFTTSNVGDGLKLATKGATDYLNQPERAVNENSKRYIYQDYINQIPKKNGNFRKTVLPEGRLQITWNAKKKANVQLPVFGYSKSKIRLNGTSFWNSQLEHTNIGALIVKQKTGKNILVIQYEPGRKFKALLWVTFMSWLFAILYLLLTLVRRVRK